MAASPWTVVAVHKELPISLDDLELLYEWDREYKDSDVTRDASREHHARNVSMGRVVYFRTMEEGRLVGHCEFHAASEDVVLDWFFALHHGEAAMNALLFYLERRFRGPSWRVCLSVSLDPNEPEKAAGARLKLYSNTGFVVCGVTREGSPLRWRVDMRRRLTRAAMDVVKHGPRMEHRIEEENHVQCYGMDVPSYFHHFHHETSPPTVEHCGGPHVKLDPHLDYTLEHCPCGKHVSDRRCPVGHDERMQEVLWHLTEPCPSDPTRWHLESGLSLGRLRPGTCANCGLRATMLCSVCKKFWYCSLECAEQHWQEHQRCHDELTQEPLHYLTEPCQSDSKEWYLKSGLSLGRARPFCGGAGFMSIRSHRAVACRAMTTVERSAHARLPEGVVRALAKICPHTVFDGVDVPGATTLVVCDDLHVPATVVGTFLDDGGETLIYRGNWPENPTFDANPLFREVELSFNLNHLERDEDGVPISTWSAHLPYRDVLFVEDLECPECEQQGTVSCPLCQEWVYCEDHADSVSGNGCPMCRHSRAEDETTVEGKQGREEGGEGEEDQGEEISAYWEGELVDDETYEISSTPCGDMLLVCAKRRSRRAGRKKKKRKKRKKKWMAGAVEEMEEGSLRAIAKRHGLLRSEKDTLSFTDLDKLESIARRRKDTKLLRKVIMARNMMKASKRRRRRR